MLIIQKGNFSELFAVFVGCSFKCLFSAFNIFNIFPFLALFD